MIGPIQKSGFGRHAEADDGAEVHHPRAAERREHGVVEGGAGGHVGALDREVIEHVAIMDDAPPSDQSANAPYAPVQKSA